MKPQFGGVTSHSVMTDANGKSKGFGFINFDSHEGAAKAVEELNDMEFHGKTLFAGRAMKKSERSAVMRLEAAKQDKSRTLFVLS